MVNGKKETGGKQSGWEKETGTKVNERKKQISYFIMRPNNSQKNTQIAD